MRHIRRFENPILSRLIRQQWRFSKICFAVIVQGILLLVICQLLFHAKMGRHTDLIFMSEALLVLIVTPYLVCSELNIHLAPFLSRGLLRLSRMSPQWVWMSIILGSQIYTFCFLGLATLVLTLLIPSISDITHLQVVQLHLVFGIYIIVAATVGGLWWRIFRHEIFAMEATYLSWGLLIGGVFLLTPLDRYLENLQPVIPPFLHLNPLIAVCHLLEIDVFRTPHLYELTPIPSYMVVYPSCYIVCGWQILIGICCAALACWDLT
jgi:hypothetical protein